MEKIIVRKASLKDAGALERIEKEAFKPQLYHLLSKKNYRHLLTRGNAEILLAVVGKAVVGSVVILYRKGGISGRVYSLAVSPDFQGKGIGGKLLEASYRAICKQGCQKVLQEIRADNHTLLKRYTAFGFKPYRECENYYPDGASCIKLRFTF